jgi:hypothetical protein
LIEANVSLSTFEAGLSAHLGDGCAFLAVARPRFAKDAHGLATHAMRRKARPGILDSMNERCLRALQARRPTLTYQWEALLHAAPINSPLGHPDTLVHMMDQTLDQIFHELNHPSARKRQPGLPGDFCRCGHNPLVMYFTTAVFAFQTTLGQCADEEPVSREDAEEVKRTINRIARREIMTFCALCLRQAHVKPPPARSCALPENQTPTA